MFSYYDTEFQPEMKRAEVERDLAASALVVDAGRGQRRSMRERLAATLIALATLLSPARDGAVPTDRAARPLSWS